MLRPNLIALMTGALELKTLTFQPVPATCCGNHAQLSAPLVNRACFGDAKDFHQSLHHVRLCTCPSAYCVLTCLGTWSVYLRRFHSIKPGIVERNKCVPGCYFSSCSSCCQEQFKKECMCTVVCMCFEVASQN